MERSLRYDRPARDWNEALPIGNGFLGGMVFGEPDAEVIQLNEDSLWYGGPRERTNPDALAKLGEIRALIFAGKIGEAERLAMLAMAGVPEHPSHYVPVGDFVVRFVPEACGVYRDRAANGASGGTVFEGYLRGLDLSEAICSSSYSRGGVRYERECFASGSDGAIVLRIKADEPGAISCAASFRRSRYAGSLGHPDGRTICMTGSGGGEGGVTFAAMARCATQGGSVRALGESLVVEGADEALFLVTAATSFRRADQRAACELVLDAAGDFGYEELRARHVADYRSYFDRMDLSFGPSRPPAAAAASSNAASPNAAPPCTLGAPNAPTTSARLEALRVGDESEAAALAELYFHFGRYLLISSSRPGSLPATLQGIWNKDFLPPWGSKYTININTEMNYWPAEKCGLGDCHEPLFDLLERMLPSGRRVAREMYGCRGFVAHHNTDLWGDCDPVDHWIPATTWPMGAAWLCLHLWEHYEYSLDLSFLERYYPIMAEAAAFFLDYLVEDGSGRLVTCPSASPENTYILPSGERGSLCYGPSMDSQILRALFSACAKAAGILDTRAAGGAATAAFEAAAARLPEPRIGSDGRLMEWSEDYGEAEIGHRHISHLFALHPDDAISLHGTPELAKAAAAVLERRLAHGGGHTGWSKAWIVNMRCRLGQGEEAWGDFLGLLRDSTLPNLFDNHPPFQIDGNFGGAAGILEMLVQCVGGEILILPALPAALGEGGARGIRAKGGFELDLEWKGRSLTRLRITSRSGGECRIRIGGGEAFSIATEPGGTYEPRP
jgi:alpha-L-fucosidase 2